MDANTNMDNVPTVTIASQTVNCPVTIDDLKAQLRFDTDAEDSLMATYIRVAAEYLERIAGIAILQRSYTQAFRHFSGSMAGLFSFQGISMIHGNEVMLLRYPISSIDSVNYRYVDGTEKVLDSTTYFLTTSKPARMCLRYGKCWPQTDMTPDSVRVNFTAGYTPATLPPELKQCIVFIAAHFFENRTPFLQISNMCEVPLTLRALIDSIRVFYW